MPLRLRLAVLFALGTAVVISVAGLAFELQLRVSLDASLDTRFRARATTLAAEVGTDGEWPAAGVVSRCRRNAIA